MSDFLTDFLASILAEQGIRHPRAVAEKVAREIELVKRDQRIYDLSGKVPTADIAARFDVTPRRCQQIIKAQLTLTRVR